ncbi:helix-turn-helix domain-containing protein [Methylobacterium sp. J-078]|jgi:transcriptional regulator with XRE-family HTH domain|uniref:helix-turn-helix domain-containing protein n=1 Tax=Methylobacterium sp. J-078 TaxID=2836657 RepID=UPI001FBA4CB8|nr:helix-turn-helix transcriptional regulator [Methylobacterium sp. J-078]MCJ2043659.1 helix-turn-helix domain-containing protein [Methylobacterium sp. J-078]
MAGQKTDARDAYVGQRIAEQRKKASLTQKRVAQCFGMSAAQLQKYEKGTNRISALHLDTFSRLTGVPIAYFFDGLDRTDPDVPGFSEVPQQPYDADAVARSPNASSKDGSKDSWEGLAEVVARHVAEHFSEDEKLRIAAALKVLDRRLGG